MGSRELIPCFTLLVHTAFALPIKLFLSQPTSFLTFTLAILSFIPPGVKWASGWLVFGCRLGLNHDNCVYSSRLCREQTECPMSKKQQ